MKKKVFIAFVAVLVIIGIVVTAILLSNRHKTSGWNPANPTVSTKDENTIRGTLTVNSETAAPGDTVDVRVSVKDNPGILGMTLKVDYVTGVLTLMNAENGDALKDVLTLTKPGSYQNNCKFLWDGMEIRDDQIKDGDMLILTFKLDENAEPGEYPILLSYSQDDIVDSNLKFIDLDIVDGGVTVE